MSKKEELKDFRRFQEAVRTKSYLKRRFNFDKLEYEEAEDMEETMIIPKKVAKHRSSEVLGRKIDRTRVNLKRRTMDPKTIETQLQVPDLEKCSSSDQEQKKPVSDYYTAAENKSPFFVDSKSIKHMQNFDITGDKVYFAEIDHAEQAYKCSGKDVFNQEYPGCTASKFNYKKTTCGLMKIEANTIRPVESVKSSQPLIFWVIKGEIVLKATTWDWMITPIINEERSITPLVYKSGEAMVLPPGLPYSLENRTKNTVTLGYNTFDVE